jgi:nucleoside-diphosphate-sugar epimerase
MAADRRVVLVTGATGQIGRALVERLLAAGETVVALRRRHRPSDDVAGVTWLDGDLERCGLSLRGAKVEHAVHATGIWLLPDHLEAFSDAGVRRLVAFSSTSIFAKEGTRSRVERAQVEAIVDAERRLRAGCERLAIAWTVLRPTLTYGCGLDRNVSAAARFIDRFGVYPVAGAARGLRQPVHAEDLAEAALSALGAGAAEGRAYDLGGGETLAYREMIGRIFDALGRPRRLVPVPVPLLAALAAAWGAISRDPVLTGEVPRRMNRDLVVDTSAAARDLGYAPRRFLAGGGADLGL